MSAQISDVFQYRNKDYHISAIEYPGAFFDIRALGLKPRVTCSACWRGYVALFGIDREKRLVLAELHTSHDGERAPEINGVRPEVFKVDPRNPETLKDISTYTLFGGELRYDGVNLPVRYSGRLTASDGFIRERYVHMGFHAPSSYKTVMEFAFEDGILVRESDISEHAKRKRAAIDEADDGGGCGEDWIEQTFDLSYESKWA